MNVRSVLGRFLEGALVAAFVLSMLLPLTDAFGRYMGGLFIPGSASYRAQSAELLPK